MQRLIIEISNPESDKVNIKINNEVVGETNDYETLILQAFKGPCNFILEDLSGMAKEVGANVSVEHKSN